MHGAEQSFLDLTLAKELGIPVKHTPESLQALALNCVC